MDSEVNQTRLITKALVAAAVATFFAGAGAAQSEEGESWVALSSTLMFDRASIGSISRGERNVWVERNYEQEVSLGSDTSTGLPIYPHRSVRIRYVVDCTNSTLNMAAWKMYSESSGKGELIWADQFEGLAADYRHAPGTEEEKSVIGLLCSSSVGGR
jgi:hypothetical protein